MSEETKKPVSPALPWRIKLGCKLLSICTALTHRKDGTVNRKIIDFFDTKVPADEKPRNGVSTSDVTVDAAINLWFRLFSPVSSTAGVRIPVIIFFHGGYFSYLSPSSKIYDNFCRRLASKIPAVIVSVNYRLSPENRFPAPYEDGETVLKWLAANYSGCLPETGDLSQCFIAGDSAGGNIAHHVGFRYASAADKFRPLMVAGILAIQPFFGGEERLPSEIRLKDGPIVTAEFSDWHWKAFLPENSNRDHPAANVFGPNSPDILQLDFPATLVFVGGFDPLQDWQKRYYEGLKRSSKVAELVEYPNAIHGFHSFPEFLEASMLISEVKSFMEKHGCFNQN